MLATEQMTLLRSLHMQSEKLTLTQMRLLNDGVLLAHASDTATDVHTLLGYGLGAYILTHPEPTRAERLAEFSTHVVAAGLDFGDGWLKNEAVKRASGVVLSSARDIRNNKPDAQEWSILHEHGIIDEPRKDERSDKKYFYTVMSALAIREALNGHPKTAAVLSANIAVSAARDKAKTDLRDYAEEHSLPTNAKKWGKVKTLLHNIGMGIVIKSGRNNIAGKAIGASLVSGGTLIGLHDYMLYRRYIRHEKARAGML